MMFLTENQLFSSYAGSDLQAFNQDCSVIGEKLGEGWISHPARVVVIARIAQGCDGKKLDGLGFKQLPKRGKKSNPHMYVTKAVLHARLCLN